MAEWPTYIVDYRVVVKAKNEDAARRSFYTVVCSGDALGLDWELIEEEGFRQIATKEEYDQGEEKVKIAKRPYDREIDDTWRG
jgi:hypothetical protein